MITKTPIRATRGAPWGAASAQGTRRHQADAAAGWTSPRTGRTAVAVADGVGDSAPATTAAAMVADHAVRVAALEGRADTGVLAAHDLLRSAGGTAAGDAALVVALSPRPGSPRTSAFGSGAPRADRLWTIAWVGDCRAWTWDGATLRPVTRDHTVAATMRAAGVAVAPSLDHVLSTSVRTVAPHEIGHVTVADPARLVLVSDGVHRALSLDDVTARLWSGGTAEQLAADLAVAGAAGSRDNATALVLDARPTLTVPTPRSA